MWTVLWLWLCTCCGEEMNLAEMRLTKSKFSHQEYAMVNSDERIADI